MKSIWVVDGAYLLKASLGKFDYVKLKHLLEELNGGEFFESYYLNSTPHPPTDEQDAFHTFIKSAPPKGPQMRVQLYQLKDVHLACSNCGTNVSKSVQKGVDVGITTIILKMAYQKRYDRLILSAGDGDFGEAIQYVKSELGKEIWICGFDGSISSDLQSFANRVIWLDKYWYAIQRIL